ncbi:MAG: T9SS type A sorting domain-containing protein [Calditrichaeota bacterium]|nr:T9SS type A sorting domain-containing protein [Calditrichota bacterium]
MKITKFQINTVFLSIVAALLSPNISLKVYNSNGQLMSTMSDSYKQAGIHITTPTATNTPSGLYFVRLEASDQVFTQKVMLIR